MTESRTNVGPWSFPVLAAISRSLIDSFNRVFIPGTNRKYVRGKHGATDISWTEGSNDRAVCEAVCVARGVIRGLEALGNQVLLRYKSATTGKARYVRYCHLESISFRVKPGKRIKRRQYIGKLGHTGQAGGPHTHFEWSESSSWSDVGSLLDPWKPLEQARKNAKEFGSAA